MEVKNILALTSVLFQSFLTLWEINLESQLRNDAKMQNVMDTAYVKERFYFSCGKHSL